MTHSPAITIDPPVVRPPLARRLGRPRIWEAMASFAAVVGCYWVYWFLAVPLVEPTVAEKSSTQTPEEMIADARTDITARQREVGKFFADDSWEQQGPAIWQSDAMGMRLLFKTFTPKGDGTVEFRPCTVMLFPKQNGKPSTERPIIMRAPQGMDVKFDKKVGPKTDWSSLKFESGRLLGAIRIYQLPSVPGATDDLEITTRDVQMAGQRAFTPPQVPVNFRLGRSQGSGTDLEILLGELDGAPASGGMMRGMALRSLSLKRNVQMRLEMSPAALGGPTKQPANAQPQPPIEIRCQGPFRYEMADNAASFHENVDVLRMNPRGESDQLNCAVLTVYFASRGEMPAAPPETAAPAQSPPAGAAPASFQVRMISARGNQVTIRSPAQAMYGRCDGIDYVPGPAGAPGSLVALGPGVITGNLPKDATGKYKASWTRELRFEPDGPLQRATLRGAAEIRFGIMGTIAADEIFAWLSRKPADAALVPNPQPPNAQPGSEAWQIERLLAQQYTDPQAQSRGPVVIDSPQLHATTVQLAATVHRPQASPLPHDPAGPGNPAVKPAAPRPVNPAERFDVRGRKVHIDLLALGEQLAVSGATIEQDAQLKQQASPERSILVKGDKMHVTEAHTPATRVTITGRPAFVDAGGMSLWGQTIDLEKSTNRLWVQGEGRMAMPVTQGLDGQAIKQPTQLTVDWHKRMEFQSQTAVFEGAVVARSQHQVLNCEVLEARLSQPIDFGNPQMGQSPNGKMAQRPELAGVRTHGRTFLESKQLDEQGQQTAFSQMELFDLSIDRTTGEIGGIGPGWVHHVTRGSAAQGLRPNAAVPALGQPVALPAPPTVADDGFSFLSVNFRKKLEGNLNRRVLKFLDKTKTVYGPVAGWNEKLSGTDLAMLGPNGIVLDAHELEVREMNKRPQSKRGWFELDATGDVMAVGQRFTALGERLTYAEEKDQMVLRGDPAEIFVENEAGGGRQETRAREVRYWFTKNYASASGLSGNLVLPPRGKEEKQAP